MKLTQCQRIIRHLQEIGPIDDLKVQGYDIEVETKRGKNRYGEETHYAVYRLKEETV